jgi:hypothetical protein
MYFISLGRHCNVAYNIKKYINNNVPTQFFDWSRTDFKCVLFILIFKNIEEIFNIKNIIVDKESYKHENKCGITLKNFVKDGLCLLYRHDVEYKNECNELEMNQKLIEFINKYKRRHNRLIELIKSDTKICFIYHITIGFDYNDVKYFNDILKNINKNVNYSLVLLVEEDDEYIYKKFNTYLKINLKKFIDININPDWTTCQYDWKNIFKIIQNNI